MLPDEAGRQAGSLALVTAAVAAAAACPVNDGSVSSSTSFPLSGGFPWSMGSIGLLGLLKVRKMRKAAALLDLSCRRGVPTDGQEQGQGQGRDGIFPEKLTLKTGITRGD